MLNFEKLQKSAAAAVAALVLSTTFVTAAVGPAAVGQTAAVDAVVASQAGA
jgi:hypothetical protein